MKEAQSRNTFMSLRSASRSNSWARVGISFSVQILRLHALLEEALEAKREEDLAFGPGSASSTSSVSSWDSVNGW